MAVPAVVPLPESTGTDVWGRLWTPGRVIGRVTPLLILHGVGIDFNMKKIAATMRDVSLPSDLHRFEEGGNGGITGGRGKVVAPAVVLLPRLTDINVRGRLWTLGHVNSAPTSSGKSRGMPLSATRHGVHRRSQASIPV